MTDLQSIVLTIAVTAALCAVLGAAEWLGTRVLDLLEERAARKHRRYMCARYIGVNGKTHD